MLTPAQYTALKSELATDPQTYGYATFITSGNDVALADLLNKLRDGSDGETAISIRRADLRSKEIWEAILVTDYTALGGTPTAAQLSAERRYLAWLAGLATIPTIRLLNDDGTDTPVIANLQAMFPGGSSTRTRLAALANRVGSRAEQLFGAGVSLSTEDIAIARNS